MELTWQDFNEGDLQGMESFINDYLSIHIVRYQYGEGFHWIARHWDAWNNCTVVGSYDYDEYKFGWEFLSDAYKSAIEYLTSIGIFTENEYYEETHPSVIRDFLYKALSIGFATMVSFSALAGMMSPTIAHADTTSPNPNDVIVECTYGRINVIANETHSPNVYVVDSAHSLNAPFQYVSEGSELYNLIMNEIDSGMPNIAEVHEGMVGQNEQTGDFTMISDWDNTHECINTVKNMYRDYYNDGQMHNYTEYIFKGDFYNQFINTPEFVEMYGNNYGWSLEDLKGFVVLGPMLAIALFGFCNLGDR